MLFKDRLETWRVRFDLLIVLARLGAEHRAPMFPSFSMACRCSCSAVSANDGRLIVRRLRFDFGSFRMNRLPTVPRVRTHGNGALVEIDVRPLQPEQLALPQSATDRQGEQRIEPAPSCGGEKDLGLRFREKEHFLVFGPRLDDVGCGIEGDQTACGPHGEGRLLRSVPAILRVHFAVPLPSISP